MARKASHGCLGCFAVLVASAVLLGFVVEKANIKVQPTPPKAPRQIADQQVQAERLKFIQSLIARGIISKVDTPGTTPRVYVLPAFYELNHDDKQQFMSVCFAHAYAIPKDGEAEIDENMRIFDTQSNKQVGSMTSRGLSEISKP